MKQVSAILTMVVYDHYQQQPRNRLLLVAVDGVFLFGCSVHICSIVRYPYHQLYSVIAIKKTLLNGQKVADLLIEFYIYTGEPFFSLDNHKLYQLSLLDSAL